MNRIIGNFFVTYKYETNYTKKYTHQTIIPPCIMNEIKINPILVIINVRTHRRCFQEGNFFTLYPDNYVQPRLNFCLAEISYLRNFIYLVFGILSKQRVTKNVSGEMRHFHFPD